MVVRNMWFFQTQNHFGLKFEQMAIFRVLRQKHVVFPNSKFFWAKIWTSDDIPGGLSETCGFSKLKIILGKNLDKWRYSSCFVRNMWFFQTQNHFWLNTKFAKRSVKTTGILICGSSLINCTSWYHSICAIVFWFEKLELCYCVWYNYCVLWYPWQATDAITYIWKGVSSILLGEKISVKFHCREARSW